MYSQNHNHKNRYSHRKYVYLPTHPTSPGHKKKLAKMYRHSLLSLSHYPLPTQQKLFTFKHNKYFSSAKDHPPLKSKNQPQKLFSSATPRAILSQKKKNRLPDDVS